jgi:hypothetical protein
MRYPDPFHDDEIRSEAWRARVRPGWTPRRVRLAVVQQAMLAVATVVLFVWLGVNWFTTALLLGVILSTLLLLIIWILLRLPRRS